MVVKLLATEGVVVNCRDSEDCTPLSLAAETGKEAVIRLLIATGKADVNAKDVTGRTPLDWAAENGHQVVVKLLQSANAQSLFALHCFLQPAKRQYNGQESGSLVPYYRNLSTLPLQPLAVSEMKRGSPNMFKALYTRFRLRQKLLSTSQAHIVNTKYVT